MNFHKFRDFSVVFLIMISNLIPFLSENTQCTISIYYVCWALLMGNVQPNYFKYSFSHFLFLLHLLDLLLLSHRSLRLCLFFFFFETVFSVVNIRWILLICPQVYWVYLLSFHFTIEMIQWIFIYVTVFFIFIIFIRFFNFYLFFHLFQDNL